MSSLCLHAWQSLASALPGICLQLCAFVSGRASVPDPRIHLKLECSDCTIMLKDIALCWVYMQRVC